MQTYLKSNASRSFACLLLLAFLFSHHTCKFTLEALATNLIRLGFITMDPTASEKSNDLWTPKPNELTLSYGTYDVILRARNMEQTVNAAFVTYTPTEKVIIVENGPNDSPDALMKKDKILYFEPGDSITFPIFATDSRDESDGNSQAAIMNYIDRFIASDVNLTNKIKSPIGKIPMTIYTEDCNLKELAQKVDSLVDFPDMDQLVESIRDEESSLVKDKIIISNIDKTLEYKISILKKDGVSDAEQKQVRDAFELMKSTVDNANDIWENFNAIKKGYMLAIIKEMTQSKKNIFFEGVRHLSTVDDNAYKRQKSYSPFNLFKFMLKWTKNVELNSFLPEEYSLVKNLIKNLKDQINSQISNMNDTENMLKIKEILETSVQILCVELHKEFISMSPDFKKALEDALNVFWVTSMTKANLNTKVLYKNINDNIFCQIEEMEKILMMLGRIPVTTNPDWSVNFLKIDKANKTKWLLI